MPEKVSSTWERTMGETGRCLFSDLGWPQDHPFNALQILQSKHGSGKLANLNAKDTDANFWAISEDKLEQCKCTRKCITASRSTSQIYFHSCSVQKFIEGLTALLYAALFEGTALANPSCQAPIDPLAPGPETLLPLEPELGIRTCVTESEIRHQQLH